MVRRLCLLLLLAAPAAARAASPPDPDDLLRRAYANYRAGSSETDVAMTIHRPDWERRMELRGWTRGENDALARFTAPAKDAGNATLKLGRETWVYNPRLNQVIKLPASMMSQSWMGSDFSYDDLAKSEDIISFYTHRLAGAETAGGRTTWTVDCVPKPGAPVVWGRVTLKIRDDLVMTEETFYDQDMKPARRMTADRVGPLGGRAYPVVVTMRPLDQPGQWTRVETLSARFDTPQPAWRFTLSNLQNPRP